MSSFGKAKGRRRGQQKRCAHHVAEILPKSASSRCFVTRHSFTGCGKTLSGRQEVSGHDFTACGKTHCRPMLNVLCNGARLQSCRRRLKISGGLQPLLRPFRAFRSNSQLFPQPVHPPHTTSRLGRTFSVCVTTGFLRRLANSPCREAAPTCLCLKQPFSTQPVLEP